jgi:hypothetical protein
MGSLAEEVADRLRREVEAGRPPDVNKWREEITRAHAAATTEAERVLCLQMFKALSDFIERQLDPEALPEWQKMRSQYYNLLLIKEATIGRTDGNIPPDKLAAITRREIAAGRMSPDDDLHKLAVAGDTVLKPLAAVSAWTAHPTMAGRLGQVLSWTANIIALAIAGFFMLIAYYEPAGGRGFILVVGACLAGVVWAAGRALRYVLAGS